MKNYYNILNIEKDSEVITIKKAYKTLAKKYHPDLNKNSDSQVKFIEINEAYKVLSDEFEKIKYDKLLNVFIVENAKKEPSKNKKYYQTFLINYKRYAYALLFFTLILSFLQFKLIYNNRSLTESSDGQIKINSKTDIKLPKQTTINKKTLNSIINNDTVSIVNQLQLEKATTKSITNNNSLKTKIVNNVVVKNNKEEIASNLILSNRRLKNAKIDSVLNIKKEVVVKKLSKKTTVVKPKYEQTEVVSNTTKRSIQSNKVHIKVKDIIVTSLQHIKLDKYKVPKKIKKTDSFKIDVEIFNNSVIKIKEKVKIMLVISNSSGKSLKIDIKRVDFSKKDSHRIVFYEKFKEKLIVNEMYTFKLYANKRLIKQVKKTI